MSRRFAVVIGTSLLLSSWMPAGIALGMKVTESPVHIESFANPVDAVSVGSPDDAISLEVSGFDGSEWSAWQPLNRENEQDPALRESNLVIFPQPVLKVRVRGETTDYEVHPIRISHAPAGALVAARSDMQQPKILSRREWGADESLLLDGEEEPTDPNNVSDNGTHDPVPDTPATPTNRVKDCLDAQDRYPDEFKTENKVTKGPNGQNLRWPQEYAPSVRLLVVHHTAIHVEGDARSGVERMRALYQYHATNRGWGDIGYHYVVDESGQIFQGRAGGDYVVGGHAYCHNIGSIGVALMGNFDEELPSQEQMKSLQWLLDSLAKKYGIDPTQHVAFHGKVLDPIVGHRQLVSTDCPGYYVWEAFGQVVTHVQKGDLLASIKFPEVSKAQYIDRTAERKAKRGGQATAVRKEGWFATGSTQISGRPGEEVLLSLRFDVGAKMPNPSSFGSIGRSDPRIGVWQDVDGAFARLRSKVQLTTRPRIGESMPFRLKIQFPREKGAYTLRIGDLAYTLNVEGRSIRGTATGPTPQTSTASAIRTPRPLPVRASSSSSSSRPSRSDSALIRIKLSGASSSVRMRLPAGTFLNGSATDATDVLLQADGQSCAVMNGSAMLASGIVRLDARSGLLKMNDWESGKNLYRGVVECRVVGGGLTLINELPLEEYLMGLAEEPDTEPYEKQRAFAIAARTYALYYMDASRRKFPGMPYDGSDSPAEFQKYNGAAFESLHPRWAEAVRDTTGSVLTKDGDALKIPYFSSDDGRTRSPAEAGWKDFPHPEVFVSKPDPWCAGMTLRGHGVGMSGCGSEAQANEGKTAEEILGYYYTGAVITKTR